MSYKALTVFLVALSFWVPLVDTIGAKLAKQQPISRHGPYIHFLLIAHAGILLVFLLYVFRVDLSK